MRVESFLVKITCVKIKMEGKKAANAQYVV